MHVTLEAPSYSDPTAPRTHRTRLISVSSTVSHTSEAQLECWKRHISDICSIFNSAPLAKRFVVYLTVTQFAKLMKAMHGDHANDQKKTVRLMLAWKKETIRMDLG